MSDENHPTSFSVISDNIQNGMQLPLKKAFNKFKNANENSVILGGYISDALGVLTGIQREGTLPSMGKSRIQESFISALRELAKIDLDALEDKNSFDDLVDAIHNAIECGAEFGITLEGHALEYTQSQWKNRR